MDHLEISRREPSASFAMPLRPEFPILVRLAQSAADYDAVCELRQTEYSRHAYADVLKSRLGQMDAFDQRAALLMAEDPITGELLGTMRAYSSKRGPSPLHPDMPVSVLGQDSFVSADRFAIRKTNRSMLATLGLMKGMWRYANSEQVEWVIAIALAPLVSKYQRVGLSPLAGENSQFYNLEMHRDPYTAVGERVSRLPFTIQRSLVPFFFEDTHPEIVGDHVPYPAQHA